MDSDAVALPIHKIIMYLSQIITNFATNFNNNIRF